jgi:hypothetical protein
VCYLGEKCKMLNMTNLTNANNVYDIALSVNQMSNGIMFNLIVLIVFILLLIIKGDELNVKNLTGISFVMLLICLVLWLLQLIASWVFIMSIMFFIGALLYYKFA